MADQIGSISIFSDLDDDNNVVIDPSYSDCDAAVALQNLRQLDTEFNINVTPDLTGRIRGINLLFGGQTSDSSIFTLTDSTYYDHKMRRKAEVLKHKNNKLNQSSQKRLSSTRRYSRQRIANLIESTNCSDTDTTLRSATFSGVFGDSTKLYYDPNVIYYDKL